jgi:hypothetical protein
LSDLFSKLERELRRAFHHRNFTHKADHLYNFCVTAHAMKDHFFEAKNIISSSEKQPYNEIWNEFPELVAASEIANSAKHFVLRESRNPKSPKNAQTKSVHQAASGIAHVFVTNSGDCRVEIEPDASDYTIELLDGRRQGLYEFMDFTAKYWQTFLAGQNLPLTKQSVDDLFGAEQ